MTKDWKLSYKMISLGFAVARYTLALGSMHAHFYRRNYTRIYPRIYTCIYPRIYTCIYTRLLRRYAHQHGHVHVILFH